MRALGFIALGSLMASPLLVVLAADGVTVLIVLGERLSLNRKSTAASRRTHS